VVNGRIGFDYLATDVAEMQRRAPGRAGLYREAAARQALDGVPAPESPLPDVVPTADGRYRAPAAAVPRINATRLYQQDGRGSGAGYLNNPFDEQGREAMLRQFWSAPLGGHVRAGLQGQEVFGRRITNGQARVAEQAAAGVLATGVGSWGLLSAIDALNGNPQTPGTMPIG
jgi:hypothetical protein